MKTRGRNLTFRARNLKSEFEFWFSEPKILKPSSEFCFLNPELKDRVRNLIFRARNLKSELKISLPGLGILNPS